MLDKPAREFDDLYKVAEETKGTLDQAKDALGEAKAALESEPASISTPNEPAAGSIFPTELPPPSADATQVRSAAGRHAGRRFDGDGPRRKRPRRKRPPAETAPAEMASAETVPTETASAETVPTETASAETVPTETASAETVPTETASAETVPTETASAGDGPDGNGLGGGPDGNGLGGNGPDGNGLGGDGPDGNGLGGNGPGRDGPRRRRSRRKRSRRKRPRQRQVRRRPARCTRCSCASTIPSLSQPMPARTMSDRAEESELEDGTDLQAEMTFVEHLVELRNRLLRVVVVVAILLLCLMPFANRLYAVLAGTPAGADAYGRQHDRHPGGLSVPHPVQARPGRRVADRNALHPVPVLGIRCAGALPQREAARVPAHGLELVPVLPRDGVRLLRRVSAHVRVLPGGGPGRRGRS